MGLVCKSGKDQSRVLAAKAEAVGENMIDLHFLGFVGNDIQVDFRILFKQIDGRMRNPFFHA